jgi:hypothetical protein
MDTGFRRDQWSRTSRVAPHSAAGECALGDAGIEDPGTFSLILICDGENISELTVNRIGRKNNDGHEPVHRKGAPTWSSDERQVTELFG